MNMKNVNFFQKHAEKLILGAAGLVALVIILIYAVGSPYTATLANQEFGPRKIEDYLREQARDLQAKVNSDQPQFEPPEIAGYSEELGARLDANPAPMMAYAPVFGRPGVGPEALDQLAPPTPYDLPHPPLPTELKATSGYAVLGQLENQEQHDQFVQLVGQKQPWDIRYVSVEGEWPLKEWRTRLEGSELPVSFWRSMIGVTATYLQREEKDPETGEWVNTTIVQQLPTQLAARPTHEAEYTDESAAQFVRFLRERQADIARPEFPPLAKGTWLPPSSDFLDLDADEHRRVNDLREDVASLKKRIERIDSQLAREAEIAARRAERPQGRAQRQQQNPMGPPRGGRRGGDMDEMMPPEMGGAGGRAPVQAGDPNAETMEQLNRLVTELAQKQQELNELVGVPQDTLTDPSQMMDPYGGMYDPGMMPPGMAGPGNPYAGGFANPGMFGNPYAQPGMMPPGNPYGQPGMPPGQPGQPGVEEIPSDDTIRVWAHDLTVEPGKTYRYRLIVSVLSPLFRQNRIEEGQKRDFYNQVALGPDEEELAASPWSEPVVVDPEYYFFFLSGSPAGQVATVEVWHIYNGQWHREKFSEAPGNPIGGPAKIEVDGAPLELNMDTGAVMVDLVAAGGGGLSGDSRLLYFDPDAAQAISSRSSQQDESSPDRIRLENLRSLQERVLAVSASAAQP